VGCALADHGKLRLVVDLETAGAAEPEYDLRHLPGPDMGPGVELLTAVMRHYQQSPDATCRPSASWPGICVPPSATRCGAARLESRSPTIAHPRSGWTTWPRFTMLGIDPEAPPLVG